MGSLAFLASRCSSFRWAPLALVTACAGPFGTGLHGSNVSTFSPDERPQVAPAATSGTATAASTAFSTDQGGAGSAQSVRVNGRPSQGLAATSTSPQPATPTLSGPASTLAAGLSGDKCACAPMQGRENYVYMSCNSTCQGVQSPVCVARAKDGVGVCEVLCSKDDVGAHGACPAGTTCTDSGARFSSNATYFVCH